MSGIIDKKGKDSVNKNLYYLISLSGAYDSQSFWKTKDIEKMDTVLNKPALDCIYTDCTDILGSLYFCSDDARTELEKRLAYIHLAFFYLTIIQTAWRAHLAAVF